MSVEEYIRIFAKGAAFGVPKSLTPIFPLKLMGVVNTGTTSSGYSRNVAIIFLGFNN